MRTSPMVQVKNNHIKQDQKIITSLPLESIWYEEEEINALKVGYVSFSEIENYLRLSKVRFVVANVGDELHWIELDKCFQFWKDEVKPHLASDLDKIYLDNFPDHYAYVASNWRQEDAAMPIVLLERYH